LSTYFRTRQICKFREIRISAIIIRGIRVKLTLREIGVKLFREKSRALTGALGRGQRSWWF
jgi:hypothetical protein